MLNRTGLVYYTNVTHIKFPNSIYEKLAVAKLFKKFHTLHGRGSSFTVFKITGNWSLR
jgi:hypothetical protein